MLAPAATTTASANGISARGWAKTIRPATVCSTRTTVTSIVAVEQRATALDDDHRPVVEVGESLAGLLALLDDLDVQCVAGQEGRLERVGELVEVQDADVVELRDAVQVVVVGQDAGPASPRELDQLGVHSVDALEDPRHDSSTATRWSFCSTASTSRPRRPRTRRA